MKNIMADRRFSNKKALSLSLGFRVLFLSLALVALPLIVFIYLMYAHLSEIKREEAVTQLSLLAEVQEAGIEEKILFIKKNLHLAAQLSQTITKKETLNALFEQMVATSEVLLLVQKDPKLGWMTVGGSNSSLFQMPPPCPLPEGSEGLQTCSWQNQDMLFFTESLPNLYQVCLIVPLQEFAYQEQGIEMHLLKAGTSTPEKTFVIPYTQLEQGQTIKVPHGMDRIGTQIPISGTSYEVMIDLPLKFEGIHEHFWSLVFWIVGLLIVVGGSIVYWLAHKMARPLANLAQVMRTVESGNYDVEYVEEPFGFEINHLGDCFNHMLKTMLENIGEAKKQTMEKDVLSSELAIGHEIQKSLFPRSLPQLPHLDIAAVFHPAGKVAGDFYDLFAVQGRLLIVMADPAGKGISACLYALSLRGMLRSMAKIGKSLEEMITVAQQLLQADAKKSGMFITAWIGILDTSTLELNYATLGHFPALLRRKSKLQELTTNGSALGVETHKHLELATIRLEPQDLLFLYTDGLLEAFKNDGKALLEKVSSVKETLSAEKYLEAIIPPPPYIDDLTLVAIKLI